MKLLLMLIEMTPKYVTTSYIYCDNYRLEMSVSS